MDELFKEYAFTMNEGDKDRAPTRQFSLSGCTIQSPTDLTLELNNRQDETCSLIFITLDQMKAWREAIESCIHVSSRHFEDKVDNDELALDPVVANIDEEITGQVKQDQHLTLKTEVSIELPSIKLIFAAKKSELSPDQGDFDPYDAGLFNSESSENNSWKLVIDAKNTKIEYISRIGNSDIGISIGETLVTEVKPNESTRRFPWLVRSQEGFKLEVTKISRNCEIY